MKSNFAFIPLIFFLLESASVGAQFCSVTGNVIVFANYDGGILNIVIDQDIPDLKIGVCTYEAVTINISGAYAGNVTEVHYAGFNSYNTHCTNDIPATTISGVSSANTEILFAPPVTLTDPLGNGSVICAYSCETGSQGGCNTAIQIAEYFVNHFNGELRMYYTQYGCWSSGSIAISNGGNCCPGVEMTAPMAEFSISDEIICPGDCVELIDISTNNPDDWNWVFAGAQVATSAIQHPSDICYDSAGNFPISLTAGNIYGSTIAIHYITVEECPIPGCTYPNALNFNPFATIDNQSCQFDCDTEETCQGDFTGDGFISVADLIYFIGLFGGVCPP